MLRHWRLRGENGREGQTTSICLKLGSLDDKLLRRLKKPVILKSVRELAIFLVSYEKVDAGYRVRRDAPNNDHIAFLRSRHIPHVRTFTVANFFDHSSTEIPERILPQKILCCPEGAFPLTGSVVRNCYFATPGARPRWT